MSPAPPSCLVAAGQGQLRISSRCASPVSGSLISGSLFPRRANRSVISARLFSGGGGNRKNQDEAREKLDFVKWDVETERRQQRSRRGRGPAAGRYGGQSGGLYIEREIFKGLDLANIKKAFQKKKDRQMQLPRSPRRN